VSATKIEMIGSEKTTMSRKVIGAVVGGVVGYAVAKRGTTKSFTQQLMYIGGGALAGYLVGNYMNRKTGIVVEKAK
jgi:presenilin-like A22 family membrane protease